IGGVALLALAGYLLWQARQEKVEAFGEISSMVVMGLICVGAGLSLRATPVSPLSRHRLFQWMLANRKNVAVGLMVLGGVLGAAGHPVVEPLLLRRPAQLAGGRQLALLGLRLHRADRPGAAPGQPRAGPRRYPRQRHHAAGAVRLQRRPARPAAAGHPRGAEP